MKFSEFLDKEWVIAYGCTEPAAIAYAVSLARGQAGGDVKKISLRVDPRMYKNCFAVGIPYSGHKIGIKWAIALGAYLKVGNDPLALFKGNTKEILDMAGRLVDDGKITVEVDTSFNHLFIEAVVIGTGGAGKVIIEGSHTNVTLIEKDGKIIHEGGEEEKVGSETVRKYLSELSIKELIKFAASIASSDRKRLMDGVETNMKIAKHGLSLFPKDFVNLSATDRMMEISKLVCAGVYARMWGEDFPVMSMAGSGNKGIVCSIPVYLWGSDQGKDKKKIEESLALACLLTSVATHHLGSLSAVCGCADAAGIGLACGLVYLAGGGEKEISLALNNMVGNVTGMICDGAKIGCAMKTMTAVDAAFRASSLALAGIGIPYEDGIVADNGLDSLKNMGRIANQGMISTDAEILNIMGEKKL